MTIEVLSPAKVNLGLEVIRKRDDGFHDIATVFQTISIFDRLRLDTAVVDSVAITNKIEQIETNLVSRTLKHARSAGITDRAWRVEIDKRIPIAAGLGGASADAAGTLVGLSGSNSSLEADLPAVALQLGSDVPFLLRGGAALASGRGEQLEALPGLTSCWMVLAAPNIELDRKTARLYEALRPEDFSNGMHVAQVANALRERRVPHPRDLENAFARPLLDLMPEIAELRAAFARAGAPFVALTGAGPSHYSFVPELREAIGIARSIMRDRPFPLRVLIARPTHSGPLVRREKTIPSMNSL